MRSCLRLLDAHVGDVLAAGTWRGLCVRHLARAARETRTARALLLVAARFSSGNLEQALAPELQPSGGTLRAGRTVRTAAACLAGDAVVRDPWYSPEVPDLGSSIWPL